MRKGVTLGELSLELGIYKSKLAYYQLLGILKPDHVVGKTGFFNKKDVVKILKKVEVEKMKGKKLTEIKKIIK